jgi:choline dehydrogenase-like flavoprotein
VSDIIAVNEVIRGRDTTGDLILDADVVVIGSGSGGAVVACELAEAGKRVVVLEEGPFVTPDTHASNRPSESLKSVWRDMGMSFAVGVGDTPMINVTMGRAVGGSSILTGGVCFRVPGDVSQEWAQDRGLSGLSEARMDSWYSEVEEAISVETVPERLRSESTRLFGKGLAKRGIELQSLRRNTDGCEGNSSCNFGCPKKAKRSVALTFIPRALKAGAQVVSDALVEKIETKGGRASGVTGRLLDSTGKPTGRLSVTADQVVVCAGAWHSPLLLKRSGIGKRLKHVGKNLTLHPSFRMMARFDQPVRGWSGALQSAYTSAYMDQGITLISIFTPPGLLAATVPGVGPEHTKRVQSMANLGVFGGLIHDDGGGTVHGSPWREPIVTYKMSKRDRAQMTIAIRLMAEIYFDAGAREAYLPILGLAPVTPDTLGSLDLDRIPGRHIECASQHPLGSCRMGTDRKHSVVNPDGRLWDLDNVWVADGSVLPTSLGVNPQLTVMAMSLRIARGIAEAGASKASAAA